MNRHKQTIYKILIFTILCGIGQFIQAQTCEDFDNSISNEAVYESESLGIKMPLNTTWNIYAEKEGNAEVVLRDASEMGLIGFIKLDAGSYINPHETPLSFIQKILTGGGYNPSNIKLNKTYIKNIKTMGATSDGFIRSFDEKIYIKIQTYTFSKKNGDLIILMLLSNPTKHSCYSEFYKKVLTATYFDHTWF